MDTDRAPATVSESPLCGFVCVCVQKSVEFNITDHKLHRANKDRELHEELEKLSDVTRSEYAYQLGGGVRVIGHSNMQSPLFIGSWGESVAVFEGTLSNLEELARTFPAAGHTVTTATFSSTPEAAPAAPATPPPACGGAANGTDDSSDGADGNAANPALVVCLMYEALGQDLLSYLRGKYSFCLYHGKTGRVLAARDSSGAVPLFQGMSAAQSLVISSRKEFLGSCEELKAFEPGYFKYGWYSEPRKFGLDALHNHHYGHQHHQHGNHHGNQGHRRGGSARNSLDVPRPAQHQAQGQGQGQAGAKPVRKSVDQGQRRGRNSLDMPSGGAAVGPAAGVGPGKAKGSNAVATAAVPEDDGQGDWSVVGSRNNRRKSIDAGATFSTRPDSGRQTGRRRSVDHSHAHAAGGGKSAPVHDKAAPKTPPTAPTTQSAAARGHSFRWDVNAPEFMPHATKA